MATSTTMTEPTTAPAAAPPPSDYTSGDIQVLEGLEAIRKRPGMYVGGTGLLALHHLVYECVDNSIDEAMSGFATQVIVRIGVDGSCTVIDDGRGMPVDPMKHENPKINGRPAVEVILTEVHAGGKFDNNAYKVSGGLHGVGVKCVNALSEWTEVEVHKNGSSYAISFERGRVARPLHVLSEGVKSTGTRISFLPDSQVFPDTGFVYESLQERLRELAYLNPGVTIKLIDERVDSKGRRREEVYYDKNGITAYVKHLNLGKAIWSPCIVVSREDAALSMRCDVAMQYTDATNENLLAFGNNIRNPDGGTHLQGFKGALTRVINAYARRENLVRDLVPTGEDLREGLTAIISVKLPNPQFNNQTKEKLLNEEVEGFVAAALADELAAWLDKNPADAKRICQKAVLAAEAREAARKARELIKRKSQLGNSSLPHKLADCSSSDVESTEMFIVEGDSAGGSAKGGRDHVHQAILPLRGKLLNVEKCRLDKVLAFEEIQTLVQALQCGIGAEMDISKLRYGRVIIMTDADVDGSHIRTLLLTFFFRQMRELVRQGKIYVAQPPLYQLARGKMTEYVLNDRQMSDKLAEIALRHASFVLRNADGTVKRVIAGDDLRKLLRQLHRLDELVTVSQRRGIPFMRTLESRRHDPTGQGHLPSFHVVWGAGDALCFSEEEARTRARAQGLVLDELTGGNGTTASMRELHENTELQRLCTLLATWGINVEDWALVQEETVTGEKLPTPYAWQIDPEPGKSGEPELVEAANIPSILRCLHEVGRRGIDIKRFKGLGEMDAEQLWETTMDPSKRTLLRISMTAAVEADLLFTTLMGEEVEPRRNYIEKHALDVKNLDI